MKDYKRVSKTINLALLPEWITVINCLLTNSPIPEEKKDHELSGDWKGFRDCHILPDLVLIYEIGNKDNFKLARLGSHAELGLIKAKKH